MPGKDGVPWGKVPYAGTDPHGARRTPTVTTHHVDRCKQLLDNEGGLTDGLILDQPVLLGMAHLVPDVCYRNLSTVVSQIQCLQRNLHVR